MTPTDPTPALRTNGSDEAATGRLVVLDRIARPRLHQVVSDMTAVRLLVADGQSLVRAGFRALLEDAGHITVVGEAATGDEVVALAEEMRPDVVLVDAGIPGLDCVEAIGRMLACPGLAVMVLTPSDHDERIFAALRAGASGLLLKDSEPAELVRAVEVLARGDALLSPSLTRRLIAELAARPEPESPASELLEQLTAREREVVVLVALGLTNAGIAERLVISPATAKTHVSRAMRKLDARDRVQLVVFAYEVGLVLPRTDIAPSQGRPVLAAM